MRSCCSGAGRCASSVLSVRCYCARVRVLWFRSSGKFGDLLAVATRVAALSSLLSIVFDRLGAVNAVSLSFSVFLGVRLIASFGLCSCCI